MTEAELRRIALREMARRARARPMRPPVDIDGVCHPKQARLVHAIVEGQQRNIEALCGRQSGKSHGASLAALLDSSARARVNWIYVTSTYGSCEKMAFSPAKLHNVDHALGGEALSGREMKMRFPNGSVTYFMGADYEKAIDRLRGTPNLAGCIIDEAGIYQPDTLKTMIEAVRPGLRPLAGKLVVMGTPSKAGKQGTWYDITQNPHYEHHRFDYRDNDRVPSFADVERLIDEELETMFPGLTPAERRDTAYFKREYLAMFEVDLAEKVYQLTDANLVDEIPANLARHAVGGDLGSTAADALVDFGWNDDAPDIYVVEQEAVTGQDALEFAAMAKAMYDRRRPLEMGVDPGGLGDKTIRAVQSLFPQIPIVGIAKPPVVVQVRVLNALLANGRLKMKRGSRLAQELSRPTWVGGIVGGQIDEHGVHSDLCPAARYTALVAQKYLPEPHELDEQAARKRTDVEERASERRRRAELRYNDQSRRDALESDDLPPPEDDDEADWSPAQPW